MGRMRHTLTWMLALAMVALGPVGAVDAQDLLDRILARVDGVTITLTDVRAALAIGLVTPAAGEDPGVSPGAPGWLAVGSITRRRAKQKSRQNLTQRLLRDQSVGYTETLMA